MVHLLCFLFVVYILYNCIFKQTGLHLVIRWHFISTFELLWEKERFWSTVADEVSVWMATSLCVCVVLCGPSGHRAMKGLRRERGEPVVLRFIFHYCQPFVMTLASTHCTYVALGLNISVSVDMRVCTVYSMWTRKDSVMIKEKTHER